MKYLLSLLLSVFFFIFTFGQSKFALIDKEYKIPILFTDSVSVEQISKGFFPVENKNIDTLIANIQYLISMLTVRQRAKMESFELRASNTIFKTTRVPFAYGDRYNTMLESVVGELTGKLLLINSEISNKKNAQKLDKLLKYLKSNQSFFKEPNEITPKLYNVVVQTD